MRKRPCAAASQNSCVSGVGTGAGIFLGAISLLTLQDEGRAGVPGRERTAGAVRERNIAVLDLHGRMRLPAQLADRLDDLRHAPTIGRMVVAQPAPVGVERP